MNFLPYSCQWIEADDVEAVTAALQAPLISQGERLRSFETAFARYVASQDAVAFSSGTAALHAMCAVAGIGSGDEVLIPALTFASTANVIVHLGGTPVFVDIDATSRTIDPNVIAQHITARTKAIMAVDFAGVPCDYTALHTIAEAHGLLVLVDAAHAIGATFQGIPVGSLGRMSAFSFGPVKNMTTGEGGMVTTDDTHLARLLRQFRAHGMTRDPVFLEHEAPAGWYYEQQHLGLNYKMTEMAAALGHSQLRKLERFNQRRSAWAAFYDEALSDLPLKKPIVPVDTTSAWHLYVIEVEEPFDRNACFRFLRSEGLGVQVHYIPVPLHPYYCKLRYGLDACPRTAAYYKRALSLPLHPKMTDTDAKRVVDALQRFFERAQEG